MSGLRFRLNEPDVTFEAFEGETLVIHLGTGNYYSLRGSAPVVWPWLAAGYTAAEIVAAVGAGGGADFPAALERFIASLREEQLIAERAETPALPALSGATTAEPLAAPVLECYRDMQDLLLLDPIHEVDVAGWPNRPPAAGPG
jgi:hypothetical protein